MSLIEAVYKGDLESTKSILAAGADVHTTEDKAKITPLHFALAFDRDDIGDLLLKNGADFKRCDCSGESPYFLAQQMKSDKWLEKFS